MIRRNERELWSPPVWVDFMARDAKSRVPLDYPGTLKDLEAHSIDLRIDMRLTLYTLDATLNSDPDDLVGVGKVEWDGIKQRWMVAIDWRSLIHVSEMDEVDRTLYRKARCA